MNSLIMCYLGKIMIVLLRCLEKLEAQKVLQELHDGPAGGHFGGVTMTHKIVHVGYY